MGNVRDRRRCRFKAETYLPVPVGPRERDSLVGHEDGWVFASRASVVGAPTGVSHLDEHLHWCRGVFVWVVTGGRRITSHLRLSAVAEPFAVLCG